MDDLSITSDRGKEETFLQWPRFEDACKIRTICKIRRHHDFQQPILLPIEEAKFGQKSILPLPRKFIRKWQPLYYNSKISCLLN